jgi:predicted extracellular nuclease
MKKVLSALAMIAALTGAAGSADAALVISQIYGGGGGTATAYDYDYIELFNNGTSAVSLSGYTVQYASATGTTWGKTTLSGTINSYGYFLIKEGAISSSYTNALPTADVTGTSGAGGTGQLSLSATFGKVALVNGTTALTGSSPLATAFVDLIGYGTTANNTTGNLVSSAVTNQTAVIRDQGGLANTFTVGTPNPHNSLSPANVSTPTPTPIPAAAWLLGSGLMGLAGFRKRKA